MIINKYDLEKVQNYLNKLNNNCIDSLTVAIYEITIDIIDLDYYINDNLNDLDYKLEVLKLCYNEINNYNEYLGLNINITVDNIIEMLLEQNIIK